MTDFPMVRVRRVKALPGHQLELDFDDDTTGVLDLSGVLSGGPMSMPLGDPAFFARVFVEMGVPTWPNGYDIDAINAWMTLNAAGELRPLTAA